MRYLNTRIWMLIVGALSTLGALVNIIAAETVAVDAWGNLAGRELDIAVGLEQLWGLWFITSGVAILLLALLTHGISQARTGAVVIGLTFVGQFVAFSTLGSKGYLEESGAPIEQILPFAAIYLIGFIACVKGWNEKTK